MKEELEEGFIHDQYGYCYYTCNEENALIYNLYTEPKYRKKGYAKTHLQYVINEIRKTGYKGHIAIEATPRENSIAVEKLVSFYKDIGLYVLETESDCDRLSKIELINNIRCEISNKNYLNRNTGELKITELHDILDGFISKINKGESI